MCNYFYIFYNLTFTLTGRSGKGSCSAAGVSGDDMDDTSPCMLYTEDDTETTLVARGTMYKAATVVHGVQLLEDEVEVSVDEMIIPDALVLLSFIAWPKHLVRSASDPQVWNSTLHFSILKFTCY